MGPSRSQNRRDPFAQTPDRSLYQNILSGSKPLKSSAAAAATDEQVRPGRDLAPRLRVKGQLCPRFSGDFGKSSTWRCVALWAEGAAEGWGWRVRVPVSFSVVPRCPEAAPRTRAGSPQTPSRAGRSEVPAGISERLRGSPQPGRYEEGDKTLRPRSLEQAALGARGGFVPPAFHAGHTPHLLTPLLPGFQTHELPGCWSSPLSCRDAVFLETTPHPSSCTNRLTPVSGVAPRAGFGERLRVLGSHRWEPAFVGPQDSERRAVAAPWHPSPRPRKPALCDSSGNSIRTPVEGAAAEAGRGNPRPCHRGLGPTRAWPRREARPKPRGGKGPRLGILSCSR